MDDPRQLAYAIATYLRMDLQLSQRLLELNSVSAKLRHLLGVLGRELEILELGHKLQKDAYTEMEGVQREYFLREQLKAIQKELGEGDEHTVEIEAFRTKIHRAAMPEEAQKEAARELERLNRLPTSAAEYNVIRTYLEWITTLPWGIASTDNLDVTHARTVLDEDHYGLDDIKDRILEFLAVRKLRLERNTSRQRTSIDHIRHCLLYTSPSPRDRG